MPQWLNGDTAFGTSPTLGWMVNAKGIAPHMPDWHKIERKDDTFSSTDFEWNERRTNTRMLHADDRSCEYSGRRRLKE